MAFVHTVPTAVAQRIAAIKPSAIARYMTPKKATAKVTPQPQPIGDPAMQQVNAILNPQYAQAADFAGHQNAAIQGFAQALMGKLSPIAGQVGADWNQAIGQTGELANRAATFLQQANPNASVQALIPGAPPEQQQQIAGQLGQTFGGGAAILNYLGGVVPGSQMATEKAAAQTQAAGYPALAALRGQQDLASALWQQQGARAKIGAQAGQLYQAAQNAQATADYRAAQLKQQAINEAGRERAAKMRTLVSEGIDPFTGKLTPIQQAKVDKINNDYNLSVQRINSENWRTKYTQSQENARTTFIQQHEDARTQATIDAAAARAAATGQAKTVKGTVSGGIYRVNPDGTITILKQPTPKAPKTPAPKTPTPLSAKDVQKYRGDAAGIANNGKAGQIWDKNQGKYVKAPVLSPYQAWQEMRQHGIPRAIAIDAINRAYGTHFNPKGKLP